MCAGSDGLVQSTRFPADSRPARLLNVDLALAHLKEHGLETSVTSSHIVEGARLQTLDLLWDLMHQIQVISAQSDSWKTSTCHTLLGDNIKNCCLPAARPKLISIPCRGVAFRSN